MKPEPGGNIVAIVAAGGAGDRAGFAAPKQFAPVGGVPMLARAVAPLVASAEIAVVCVAVASAESERARAALRDFSSVKILPVGKQTRARTVRAAVCEACADDDWALVHDAARPFLPPELLSQVVAAAKKNKVGALPVAPLSDALKVVDENKVATESVPRAGLFCAQTPQMFRAGELKTALAAHPDAADECEAMHRAGFFPAAVPGDSRNVKLTFPSDFKVAEALCMLTAKTFPQPESQP